MIDYRSFTISELECWARQKNLPLFRGRQLFKWLWAPGFSDFFSATDLPVDLRKEIDREGVLTALRLEAEETSADGTKKFAWRLPDDLIVESVLIPDRNRNTLCISSQVGCAMGCRFCHTARMGFFRDLLPSEIAGQVLAAVDHLGGIKEKVRNLVYMGMGEPLANYAAVLKSIDILTADAGLNFSLRRITVSTCGLVPEILNLGRDTDVGLAVSLHAPDDLTRSGIMPVNRRYPVGRLVQACRDYRLSRRRRITFEYLLLDRVNSGVWHARALAELLRDIPSKINLIPFNESPGLPFRCPPRKDVLNFQEILRQEGYNTVIRKSRGADISAACGQLFRSIESRLCTSTA